MPTIEPHEPHWLLEATTAGLAVVFLGGCAIAAGSVAVVGGVPVCVALGVLVQVRERVQNRRSKR